MRLVCRWASVSVNNFICCSVDPSINHSIATVICSRRHTIWRMKSEIRVSLITFYSLGYPIVMSYTSIFRDNLLQESSHFSYFTCFCRSSSKCSPTPRLLLGLYQDDILLRHWSITEVVHLILNYPAPPSNIPAMLLPPRIIKFINLHKGTDYSGYILLQTTNRNLCIM